MRLELNLLLLGRVALFLYICIPLAHASVCSTTYGNYILHTLLERGSLLDSALVFGIVIIINAIAGKYTGAKGIKSLVGQCKTTVGEVTEHDVGTNLPSFSNVYLCEDSGTEVCHHGRTQPVVARVINRVISTGVVCSTEIKEITGREMLLPYNRTLERTEQ